MWNSTYQPDAVSPQQVGFAKKTLLTIM